MKKKGINNTYAIYDKENGTFKMDKNYIYFKEKPFTKNIDVFFSFQDHIGIGSNSSYCIINPLIKQEDLLFFVNMYFLKKTINIYINKNEIKHLFVYINLSLNDKFVIYRKNNTIFVNSVDYELIVEAESTKMSDIFRTLVKHNNYVLNPIIIN